MKDKPEAVVKKIMEGKLAGYYEDNVLYDMEYLLGEGEDMNVVFEFRLEIMLIK